MILTNEYCLNIELFKEIYGMNQSSQPCFWFLVLDQTNCRKLKQSIIRSAFYYFFKKYQRYWKPKKIHRTTFKLKFFGIYYLTVVFLLEDINICRLIWVTSYHKYASKWENRISQKIQLKLKYKKIAVFPLWIR